MPAPLGKLRRLAQTATPSGVFTILALDHRGALKRILAPHVEGEITYEYMVDFKMDLVRTLAPLCSAILMDPVYGLGDIIARRALPGRCGLLVALEETGYEQQGTERKSRLVEGWSVCKIVLIGAQAVKVLLYYHPKATTAPQQEELIHSVSEACRKWEIPFFLEPVSYSIDPKVPKDSPEFAAQRPHIVIESARRLSPYADVLKAEYPTDPQHPVTEDEQARWCRELTQASQIPWVLLSAGVTFEEYARQVRIACENGASGILAGRAIWQEAVALQGDARVRFLQTEGAQRTQILNHIVEAYARPWWEAYQPAHPLAPLTRDWYQRYGQELCE